MRRRLPARELMGTDRTAPDGGVASGVPLAEAFRLLDEQRMDIDHRLAGLTPGDPVRHTLWEGLDTVLTGLREVVGDLAKSPAADLGELRAKSAVLAKVLRSE